VKKKQPKKQTACCDQYCQYAHKCRSKDVLDIVKDLYLTRKIDSVKSFELVRAIVKMPLQDVFEIVDDWRGHPKVNLTNSNGRFYDAGQWSFVSSCGGQKFDVNKPIIKRRVKFSKYFEKKERVV